MGAALTLTVDADTACTAYTMMVREQRHDARCWTGAIAAHAMIAAALRWLAGALIAAAGLILAVGLVATAGAGAAVSAAGLWRWRRQSPL